MADEYNDDVNAGGGDEGDSSLPQSVGTIRAININEEMRGSYLDYAMSVIVARALPDARDGLKPVHRRILYAMYDMGIRPGTPYKKSARIVGEVLGKYHPHGDSAVYNAMARMAQDFSLRYLLVDGQGNFGSLDGDSPAAMRYTEARMSRIGDELMTDINMETVDFGDNYDGTQQEPIVLPARIPNLLANGVSGIAVGMATNIPPHNLRELASAITYMIDNFDVVEDITVDDLIQFVKGPDFPTGGLVIANDELKEAYATGKGRVVMRATCDTEEGRDGYLRLVFNSFPYQVSKVGIIEKIVQLVREGRLNGIRDLRDESDRDGQRLVVELKKGATPELVRNQLYKFTPLQSTFSIQMLALAGGEPRTLSLKRALQIFIDHRYEVITRRSEFELKKRQARAHILDGLLKALSSIDAIIRVIRSAEDAEQARNTLMERFGLSDLQADAILEMQLRRLAALERQKITDEFNEVTARIAYLEDLLQSPAKIRGLIRDDINEIAETFGDKRRTEIDYADADFDEDQLHREEEVVITLSVNGYIKRVPAREYRAQRRGGKGVTGMSFKSEDDVLMDAFACSSLDSLLFFSNLGRVYSKKAYKVPESARASKGTLIHAILPLESEEWITAVVNIDTFDRPDGAEAYFVMATHGGKIKRVTLDEFRSVRPSGLIAINLLEGDTLGWVKYTDGDQEIMLATESGQSIRFHESSVRVMGRMAIGVNSIRMDEGDRIAGMDVVKPEHTHLLVLTRNGFGKRTNLDEYRAQGRYGMGIRTLARNEKTGPVVAMRCITTEDEIVVLTRLGIVLRTSQSSIRDTGRNTQGVRVIRLADDDDVVAMAILTENEDDEAAAPNGNGAAEESVKIDDLPEAEAPDAPSSN
ncbi:MAG: DNA gyrase subunit A [Chloroflexi bacterium]|nr:DNA gyrase subunit A [Chloroflexota bacterium]